MPPRVIAVKRTSPFLSFARSAYVSTLHGAIAYAATSGVARGPSSRARNAAPVQVPPTHPTPPCLRPSRSTQASPWPPSLTKLPKYMRSLLDGDRLDGTNTAALGGV